MTLLMKCGHRLEVDVDKVTSPTCWCGESIVARPLDAPAPRFVGHVQGPHTEGTFLGPIAVDLTVKTADDNGAPDHG